MDAVRGGSGLLRGILRQHDVRESVHHDIIMKITNKMQLCRLIYYSLSALHVSGDVFAHHQKHLTVYTASDNVHERRCWLVLVNIIRCCIYS